MSKIKIFQSSVISFTFCNIYLHELDIFINESERFAKFRSAKASIVNPKFKALLSVSKEENKKAETIKRIKGKLKY
jgi:hypothetical protein